jgi:ABC-type transport system substrate-binding protein
MPSNVMSSPFSTEDSAELDQFFKLIEEAAATPDETERAALAKQIDEMMDEAQTVEAA